MTNHAHAWEDACTAMCPAHEDYVDALRSCGCCDGSDG